jgi:hypothetical protein
MRRLGALLGVFVAIGSAGCLRFLDEDYVCDDECLPFTHQCSGSYTQICIIDPFFGCFVWMDDENCEDRAAICVDAECFCPPGWDFEGPGGPCAPLPPGP